ncbi:MAG: hypothetical protein NVS2B12_23430 [Ktedonobacteraceae bacterium]
MLHSIIVLYLGQRRSLWYFSRKNSNNKTIAYMNLEIFCARAGQGLGLKMWDYHEEAGAKRLGSDERKWHS